MVLSVLEVNILCFIALGQWQGSSGIIADVGGRSE
jgi:hypothetical protein